MKVVYCSFWLKTTAELKSVCATCHMGLQCYLPSDAGERAEAGTRFTYPGCVVFIECSALDAKFWMFCLCSFIRRSVSVWLTVSDGLFYLLLVMFQPSIYGHSRTIFLFSITLLCGRSNRPRYESCLASCPSCSPSVRLYTVLYRKFKVKI